MPGINNRVFGSDIDNRIKKKLEARQLLAEKDRSPLEQIRPSQYPDDRFAYYTHGELNDLNFDGVADLSSRTPFVRMWTAVEIKTLTLNSDETVNNTDDLGESALTDKIKKIENDKSKFYEKKGKKLIVKDVKSFERIVYEINNHTHNEFSDVLNQRQGESSPGSFSTDVIPNVFETNNNEFMKPAAGITSVTSNTEGMLGTIKKTSVNFIVHNFHDYDKIYSKYFLRPGAQIFIDFGWDSIDELYKPQKLIDTTSDIYEFRGKTIEEALFGEKGYVTQAYGDLETLVGLVTSFDAKVKENGSVECSLEIVSKNSALINGDLDDKIKNKLKYFLDLEIMNYASLYFDGKIKNFLDGNYTNSVDDIDKFNKIGESFAASIPPMSV